VGLDARRTHEEKIFPRDGYPENNRCLDDVAIGCHIGLMDTISPRIRTVCVYCGSGPGTNPHFVEAAKAFGKTLAESGIGLVYGGGSVGLMGAIASSVLDHGGKVTGIIPEFLTAKEHALKQVQEMIVTRNMHERKQLMFDRSDAFVAFPGGIGTLEELVEQLTWAQLGRHNKPILMANIDGFWEPLLSLIDHMRSTQFIRPGLSVRLLMADKVDDILPTMQQALEAASPLSTADVEQVSAKM
jgi:uncharacterized protein (TIGR00730 family)